MNYRRIPSFGAIAVSVLALSACGSSSTNDSSEIVARVAGVGTITKATLEHWIPIEARLVYKVHPVAPVPAGVVPDPPQYTTCIAYLRVTPQTITETPGHLTAIELRQKCVQRYKQLKEVVLNTLLAWEWTIGAGAQSGVKPTDAEIQRWLRRVAKTENPNKGEFAKYLKYSGETVPDIVYRSKVQLTEVQLVTLRTKLEKQTPKGLTPKQQQATPFGRFLLAMPPNNQ